MADQIPGARVNVVAPDGKMGSVPADKLEAAQKLGYRVASGEATFWADYDKRRLDDAESLSGRLQTFGEGAVMSLSGGLAPGLFNLDQQQREDIRYRQAVNPATSMTGEVVGAVLPIGAPGLAMKAGSAVERAVGGGGVLRTVAQRGLGGAAEGGAFGVTMAFGDETLAAEPTTAESLAAHLKSNVLLGITSGGLVGGGLALAGRGAGKLQEIRARRRSMRPGGEIDAAPHVIEETALPGAEGAADDLLDIIATEPKPMDRGMRAAMKAGQAERKAQIDALEKASGGGKESLGAEHEAWKADLDVATRGFRDHIEDLDLRGYQVRRRANNILEGKRVEEYAYPGAKPAGAAGADGVETELEAQLQASLDAGAKGPNGTQRMARGIPEEAPPASPQGQSTAAIRAPIPGQAERRAGMTQILEDGQIQTVAGDERTIRELLDTFESTRTKWRKHFGATRKTVGGTPKKPQHVYSSALGDDELRGAISNLKGYQLHEEFRRAFVDLAESLRPVEKFADQAGNADVLLMGAVRRGDDILERMAANVDDDVLTAMRSEWQAFEATLKKSPDDVLLAGAARRVEIAEAAGWKATDAEIRQVLDLQYPGLPMPKPGTPEHTHLKALVFKQSAKLVQQRRADAARAAAKAERAELRAATAKTSSVDGFAQMVGQVALAAGADWLFDNTVGTVFAGIVGGKLAARFARRLRYRIGPQNHASKVRRKLEVYGTRKIMIDRIAQGVERFASGKTGQRLESATTAAARSMWAPRRDVEPKGTRETAAVIAAEVQKASRDPLKTSEAVMSAVPDIVHLSLDLYDQLDAVVRRNVAFLSLKAPQSLGPAVSGKLGSDITQDDAEKFLRSVAAVNDPVERMMGELESGMVTPETTEACQACFPGLFAELRERMVDRIDPTKLSAARRTQLAIMFDVAVDPSLEPSMLALMQANYATEEAQPKDLSKNAIGSMRVMPTDNKPTTAQRFSG